MLRRNLRYKILALGVALVIWAWAGNGQNPNVVRDMRANLEIREVQSGYIVTNVPKTVKVRLEGQRNHVETILAEPDAVTAHVKIGQKAPGRYMLPVKADVPIGLKGLVRAMPNPAQVAVTVDEKAQRSLPIDVQFLSPPPVGYRFGAPELSPRRALVAGTAQQVDSVVQLMAAVDAKSAGGDQIEVDLEVTPLDREGRPVRGVEVNPSQVHMQLQLIEAPASRIIFISPDIVGQPAFPYKVTGIEVSPQTVAVTGRADQLSGITTLRTEPISVAGQTSTFSKRVRVLVPKGIVIGDNASVRVTVQIAGE